MKSLPLLIAAAAALAACNQKNEPEVVDTRAPDPNASALANAAPVELPPAIRAQKTYRCADNRLVNVTWFTGDKQASVTVGKGSPVIVKSEAGATPWKGDDGTALAGTDDKITVTPAGGKALSCHT